MLTRTDSPIRDQQRVSALSAPSKMVFPSGIVRKSSQALLESRGGLASYEAPGQVSCLAPPDGRVERVGRGAAKSYMDRLVLENTTSLGLAAHDLRHPAAALVVYSELLARTMGHKASESRGVWSTRSNR